MRRMIPFSEIQAEDAVGAKAKNVALLFQSGFPVSKGFIITAASLTHVIQKNQDPESRVFPESLRQEIEEAYKTYVNPPVVVRSSCSAEDLELASFAGQYETILNVTSASLLEAIMRCWLSVYKDHARSYLAQRRYAGGRIPEMSIIVQELIEADSAGVVFSKNPITGNEDEIIINSSFGLGEAVVSGLVVPDHFILSKREAAILTMELGEKESKIVIDRNGTRIVETPPREKTKYSLQDEQLHELMRMAIAVESFFGHPVDLEFAYRQGKLYILQARPITT